MEKWLRDNWQKFQIRKLLTAGHRYDTIRILRKMIVFLWVLKTHKFVGQSDWRKTHLDYHTMHNFMLRKNGYLFKIAEQFNSWMHECLGIIIFIEIHFFFSLQKKFEMTDVLCDHWLFCCVQNVNKTPLFYATVWNWINNFCFQRLDKIGYVHECNIWILEIAAMITRLQYTIYPKNKRKKPFANMYRAVWRTKASFEL